MKTIKNIKEEEVFEENFDRVPYLFRDYLYNFTNLLKLNFKEDLLSIILFGSIARGKWTYESDIDIFILFSNKISNYSKKLTEMIFDYEESTELINEKGKKLYCSIQDLPLQLRDLDNFRTLFYDIVMDGIILFDRNQIGFQFFKIIKKKIYEKGLKRVYINETDFYWERKEIKFGEIVEL